MFHPHEPSFLRTHVSVADDPSEQWTGGGPPHASVGHVAPVALESLLEEQPRKRRTAAIATFMSRA